MFDVGDWRSLVASVPDDVRTHFGLDRVPVDSVGMSIDGLLALDDQVVMVTGGGGADLGGALCHRLASLGAAVAVVDIDADAADRTSAAIRERTGAPTIAVQADVTDWSSVRQAIDEITATFGRLDTLVNNAGGALGTHGPYAGQERSDIDKVLQLNLVGVMYSSHAALGQMIEQGAGRIITIASEGGRVAMRDLVTYNTAKAGVLAFMRNLSREVGPLGVSTVSVCPGALIGPRLVERMKAYPNPIASGIDQGFASTSLGRLGLPDEVAVLVSFLASRAGSWIHGTEISISGGQSA